MTYPEPKDVEIPEEIVEKWQKLVNIMAEVIDVPAGLIMRVKSPYIEVFSSSESEKNPYEVGETEHLAGLYCEKVIESKDELLVSDARKDERWKDNPDVELGMVSYLGLPLEWPDGDVFGTICVLDSDENRYSEKYEDLMRQFKKLVESHLKLIYQRNELERQIQRREEAEQREEFLHSLLRHDVRNKLQIVVGYLELMEDHDVPKELKDYIAKAQKGAREGTDIIEKVRSLRKAQDEEVRAVKIDSTIYGAVDQIENLAEEEDMKIDVECPEKGCKCMGGSLLDRVFYNIIENSVQHSDGSKIRIRGRIGEDKIKCIIEDDGKGIPEEERDRIFNRGYTTDEERGTGLGMFLVKKLLEIYGGSIKVKDSKLGGARFDVHLQKA